MAVETLVKIRNQNYGHAKEGIMSDADYNASIVKIERCILDIAKVCNKETQFKQKLREAKDGALDQTLFTQYQNNLMETLTRQADIHQSVADLAPTINKIDQTHMEIDCHMEEQTFVETNAVRKCKEWMNKKDVFVIIGNEGSGKSRIGLEILRQFGKTEEDFDLLKLTNIQQVKDIITDERKTAVLIDDAFSSKQSSNDILNNCHALDLLNARKCKGNVKIIFTVDSSKMNSFEYLLVSHRLFQNNCKIDLNSQRFCISEDEKSKLLFKFCKKHGIRITWNSSPDTEDFSLDGRTVYEIAKTDPFIGYPKLCFMFTSSKSFYSSNQGVDKSIATVLNFIENDIKDQQHINRVLASKKAVLASFYYLCEKDDSDLKLELIYGLIENCGLECCYDYSIQKAMTNGNYSAVSFLFSKFTTEIDITEFVFEIEDISKLWELISHTFHIELFNNESRTNILEILFRSLSPNLFNFRKSINTACNRHCKDLVTGILNLSRTLSFDTSNIVNTACSNKWEEALQILLNKNYVMKIKRGKSSTLHVNMERKHTSSGCY
ncbi:unnamed protein product [Mytilus edulis]|uniref:Novel STAND NTPase 3 domain-containing protein n=1 Tax=Mytilus edulis TaxID=6550 RepID=A0A8S3Q4I8_MYTED|nr:unnamed protein product [Mytilus edulis]